MLLVSLFAQKGDKLLRGRHSLDPGCKNLVVHVPPVIHVLLIDALNVQNQADDQGNQADVPGINAQAIFIVEQQWPADASGEARQSSGKGKQPVLSCPSRKNIVLKRRFHGFAENKH